jgi:hypothetical protein
MAKAALHKKKSLFTSKLDLNLGNKHLEHSFVCAETWTLPKIDQKYLGKFSNVMLEKDGNNRWD